jgi:hypothetical protein
VLTLVALGATAGLCDLAVGRQRSIIDGALAMDDLTLALTLSSARRRRRRAAVVASLAPREAGEGEYYALLLTSVLGMTILVAAQNFVVLIPRLRAALDPALRAVRDAHPARALARVRPEVPDHRIGRLGDASCTGWRCCTARRARPTTRAWRPSPAP